MRNTKSNEHVVLRTTDKKFTLHPSKMNRFLVIIVFTVLSLLCGGKVAVAQGTNSNTQKENVTETPSLETRLQEAFRVFVPFENDNKPVGDYYYVSEVFHSIINSMMENETDRSRNWRIVKARYVGSLINPLTQRMRLFNLKAVYDIELDGNGEPVLLRLPKMPLLSDGVRFEKNPVRQFFSGDEREVIFQLENREKGIYQLEIPLEPTIEMVDGYCRVEVPIPKVPDSVLELSIPMEAPLLTINNSVGAVRGRKHDPSGNLVAQIGPSGKFSFSWIDEPGRTSQANVEVDQYFWLRAQPNFVDIRAQFKFRIKEGKVSHLAIATDPKLQIYGQIRCDEAELLSEQGEQTTDSDGIVRIFFKTPVSDQVTIRANYVFVVKGSTSSRFSGIGNLRLPVLSASGAKIVNSWLGVSDDPRLICELPRSSLSVDNFRNAWRASEAPTVVRTPADDPPLRYAYDLSIIDPEWSMSIRKKELEHTVAQHQSFLFSDDDVLVRTEMNIESSGETFQHTLLFPDGLNIEQILVRDAQNNPREIRWIESNRQNIGPGKKACSIFFRRPLNGKYKLEIDAVQPLGFGRDFKIPLMELEGTISESNRILLYRDHDVLLQYRFDPNAWKSSDVPIGESLNPLFTDVVPVALFESVNEVDPEKLENASVNLRANLPKVSGWQLSSYAQNRSDDTWDVGVDFHLDITEGEVDSIRLHLKDSRAKTITSEPLMGIKEEVHSSGRYIILKPAKPLKGTCDFSVRFNVPGGLDSITVPPLEYAGASELQHYLNLPRTHGMNEIDWDFKHLRALTDEEQEKIVEHSKSVTTFTLPQSLLVVAEGPEFSAKTSPPGSHAHAKLNDIGLYFSKNGGMFGVSNFVMNAYGADHCVLNLPLRYELIHVTSGGITTKPIPISPGKWRIELWPNPLPQKIEILFSGQLDASTVRGETFFSGNKMTGFVPIPYLENVTVEQTTWSISLEASQENFFNRLYSIRQIPRIMKPVYDEDSSSTGAIRRFDASTGKANESELNPPVSLSDLPDVLYRYNLIRLDSLTSLMEEVASGPFGGNTDELQRWYSHWGREVCELNNEIDSLSVQRDAGSNINWQKAFYIHGAPPETVTRLSAGLGLLQKSMRTRQETIVRELKLEPIDSELGNSKDFPVDLFTIWRMGIPEDTSFLFGISEGGLDTIEVSTISKPWSLTESGLIFHSMIAFGIFLVVLLARRTHLYRFFSQYPYFCGTATGILCWSILGLNLLAACILLLTWLAWFWPIWKKRRREV